MADDQQHNKVGPVLRAGEVADAALQAVYEDNPDSAITVEDRTAYLRVEMEQECDIRRDTIEAILGRPFQMRELETVLGSFAGRIETTSDYVRFYYEKTL